MEHYFLREEDDFTVGIGFAEAVTDETDMVFLCNPNNPTDRLVEASVVEALCQACREKGAWLVIDECFLSFTEGSSAVKLLEKYENLIVLKAFTKMYAMAGLRLGYSTPAQVAGETAMTLAGFPEATRQAVEKERRWLMGALSALPIKVYPADGTFILFRSTEDLWEAALKKGILLRSCANFYGLDSRYYRIGIKKHEDNCSLLSVLTDILR